MGSSNDLKQWEGWVMLTRSFDFHNIALPMCTLLYCYGDGGDFVKTVYNGKLIRFDSKENRTYHEPSEFSKIDISKYIALDEFLELYKPFICEFTTPTKEFLERVFYFRSRGISEIKARELSALAMKEGVIYYPRTPIYEFYEQFDIDVWNKFNKSKK